MIKSEREGGREMVNAGKEEKEQKNEGGYLSVTNMRCPFIWIFQGFDFHAKAMPCGCGAM